MSIEWDIEELACAACGKSEEETEAREILQKELKTKKGKNKTKTFIWWNINSI